MPKYSLLRERLVAEGVIAADQLEAASVPDSDLLKLAHDPAYVDQVMGLTLDSKKVRRIGLPLTREMVNRTMVSLDASCKAAEFAIDHMISASLASGTHHACSGHGEGYCFFNDFAVISRKHPELKILIIDLDVHQGNGNSEILCNDPHVDIIDLYCEQNYPFRKTTHGFAFPLQQGMEDEEYLATLDRALEMADGKYDLILYQAGVDVFAEDDLGLLNISKSGIKERDERVFRFAIATGTAISFVIGGGYCKDITQTVDCNFNTFTIAKQVFGF